MATQPGQPGVDLFGVHYWSDVFASLVGRRQGKLQVKYDPRDLSQIWVITDDGLGKLPPCQIIWQKQPGVFHDALTVLQCQRVGDRVRFCQGMLG